MPDENVPPQDDAPLPEKPSSKHLVPEASQLVNDLINNALLIESSLELDDVDNALTATRNSLSIVMKISNLIGPVYLGSKKL